MKIKELPVGARVTDHTRYFPWIVAEQSSPEYGGTVLLSDYLAEAGCFDAPEPDSRFDTVRQFGWNRYPKSNVHQWLNSEAEAGWFQPSHATDCPPDGGGVTESYADRPGFLNGFSTEFLSSLLPCQIVYAIKDDFYQIRYLKETCRVFLPSRTELGAERRDGIREGTRFALADFPELLNCYPDGDLVARHRLCDRDFHPSTPYPYWLRSADSEIMSAVYFLGMSRAPWFHASQVSCGIRPAVVLDRETELEEVPDRWGVYCLKGGSR